MSERREGHDINTGKIDYRWVAVCSCGWAKQTAYRDSLRAAMSAHLWDVAPTWKAEPAEAPIAWRCCQSCGANLEARARAEGHTLDPLAIFCGPECDRLWTT